MLCIILESGNFILLCPSLVTIHDGDGHDEEANVGLEGREEGSLKHALSSSASVPQPASLPTSMMTMTGAMKAQMK